MSQLLVKYRKRPLLVGSFTAASNVTGVLLWSTYYMLNQSAADSCELQVC